MSQYRLPIDFMFIGAEGEERGLLPVIMLQEYHVCIWHNSSAILHKFCIGTVFSVTIHFSFSFFSDLQTLNLSLDRNTAGRVIHI
jgi:hypothetical protein